MSTRFLRVLGYSGAYLAIIAAVEVAIVESVLGLPPSPAPFVGALITFAVYANDRLVDLDTDGPSNPRRTAFVRRHRGGLYALAAVAYGVGAALAVLGGPLAFGLALLPGCVWVLYAVDWLSPTAVPYGRLKEVLLLNSLLVAAAWSLSVVLLPLAFANASAGPAAAVLLAYFLLATFVNTEIANIRDVTSDAISGARTLPTTIGVRRARTVLTGVTVLVMGLLAFAVHVGIYRLVVAGALLAGLLALLLVQYFIGRSENRHRLAIAAECTRFPVWALLVIVGIA